MFRIVGRQGRGRAVRKHRARGFADHPRRPASPPTARRSTGSTAAAATPPRCVAQDVADRQDARDRRGRQGRHRRHHAPIPKTGEVEAYVGQLPASANGSRSIPTIEGLARLAAGQLDGEFGVQSRTDADDKWIVGERPADRAAAASISTTAPRSTLTELYVTRARARRRAAAADAPGRDRRARRPDAVSLPDAAARQRPGRRRRAEHARCRWCCWSTAARGRATATAINGTHQWLANRGYAVLSVNFRGSTGFGKAFVNAGNLRMGPQDARRPDRRGRLGGRARHRHRATRSRSWAAATAATRRSSA